MSRHLRAVASVTILAASAFFLYSNVIARLVHDWWIDDNYSHGFLIVPIALFLVWERRQRLLAAAARPSYVGLLVVAVSIAVVAAGVLGAELFLTRISLLGVLAGTVLFMLGPRHLAILAFPLAFLTLMIPIPAIVFNQIAFPLQLLASRFGEFALSAAGIPVLREGNVIALATTSLEVAEACSGIRSLISLLTLAIVYGYLTDSRIWARVVLALAAIPVAIVANGVRVAGTGIAAHHYGAQVAMGFFHTFSGWLVFLVAFLLLFVVQRGIVLIAPPRPVGKAVGSRQSAVESRQSAVNSQTDRPPRSRDDARVSSTLFVRAVIVSVCLSVGAALIAGASKTEPVLPRESFATFPMQIGSWHGEPAPRFDQQVLTVLGVDEYISRVYYGAGRQAVGLYVGYYRSQRQGDTMHSPLNCLPGAGWEPVKRQKVEIRVPAGADVDPLVSRTPGDIRAIAVNQFVIQKGLDKQVVLYWYQSHGRVVASEYWGKIYTVLDSIRLRRTDAAMIRLISVVDGGDAIAEAAAERAVTDFAREMFPLLRRYLPD